MKKLIALLLTVSAILCCLVLTSVIGSAEEEADIYALPGASIRVGEDAATSGLRFTYRVRKAAIPDGATVGALIIPVDLLGDTDLTVSALDAADKSYLNITTDPEHRWNANSDEEWGEFHASIVNLFDFNFARAFVSVGYIKTAEGAYTYSAKSDSRSVYTVAKKYRASEEWASAGENTARRVTSYLDSVVEWNPYDGILVAPAGYASPYSVGWADGVLTVSGEGLSNIKSFLIGETVYSSGWSIDGNTLTSPFSKPLPYRTWTFSEIFSRTSAENVALGNPYLVKEDIEYGIRKRDGITFAHESRGEAIYLKAEQGAASSDSFLNLEQSFAAAMGESTKFVLSVRLARDSDADSTSESLWRFRGKNQETPTLFTTKANGDVRLLDNADYTLTALTDTFQTLTFVVDFADSTVTAYCNGAFCCQVSAPALTEAFIADATTFTMNWYFQANGGALTRGLLIDDMTFTVWDN